MAYLEIAPPATLAHLVHCAWVFEAASTQASDRIVPDGRPEFLLQLGAPFEECVDGQWREQPRALFAGQLTQPLHVRATGPACVVAVRFRPAGARPFVGVPLCALTDRRVAIPLDDASLAAIEGAQTGADRARGLLDFVAAQCARHPAVPDEAVARCAAQIERTRGDVALEALLALAGVGRRQLERRFLDVVGVSPRLLANIFRFRHAFDLLQDDTARPWTEAAIAAGYFDQSHFIREFRRFVGCTPTQFRDGATGLADALVQNERHSREDGSQGGGGSEDRG